MASMKNKYFIVILLILASSLSGITTSNLYKELIKKYDKVETFQAEIKQTSYYSEIDYTNISAGKIYYNSDKILIEYSSPKVEKILLSDNVVKIYQTESDRLIMTYADSSFVSLNMKYLISRIWDEELLKLTENSDYYIVKIKLTEKNAMANIDNIEFSIDKAEKLVKKVKYQDNLANEVEVIFSQINLNKPLSDELWKIKTTDSTQIIDYRE